MDMSVTPVAPALKASNPGLPAAVPARAVESTAAASRPNERVEPVDPTQLPAPIKGLGIAPLDLFQVGDNDDVPLPPDPPRDPIMMVAPLEFGEDRSEGEDIAPVIATVSSAPAPAPAPQPQADAPQASAQEAAPELARAVQALDEEPRAPSFDIRR